MPQEKKLSKQNELFAQIVEAMDELGCDVFGMECERTPIEVDNVPHHTGMLIVRVEPRSH